MKPDAPPGTAMGVGHVGLGPDLVDEDEAGRIEPALIGAPLCPSPGDPGTLPLAREQAFFERQSFAFEERPPRTVARLHTAIHLLAQQAPRAQVRFGRHGDQQPLTLGRKPWLVVPAQLARRDAARPALPLDRRIRAGDAPPDLRCRPARRRAQCPRGNRPCRRSIELARLVPVGLPRSQQVESENQRCLNPQSIRSNKRAR